MKISIGNDIIRIERVKDIIASKSLPKILDPSEINRSAHDHIAGRIALKEAAVKALGLSIDDWLRIRIRGSTKPHIELLDGLDKDVESIDCSISHDGDYAIATVVVLYR